MCQGDDVHVLAQGAEGLSEGDMRLAKGGDGGGGTALAFLELDVEVVDLRLKIWEGDGWVGEQVRVGGQAVVDDLGLGFEFRGGEFVEVDSGAKGHDGVGWCGASIRAVAGLKRCGMGQFRFREELVRVSEARIRMGKG